MLSKLLQYPEANYKKDVALCLETVKKENERLAGILSPFEAHVAKTKLSDLQELYVRTFDIQALCPLDLGYVIFGEDYKRGRFLVEMKGEHQKAGHAHGVELPDHLPYVLDLLPKMDPQDADDLVKIILLPALEKMLKGFEKKKNVYSSVLEAIQSQLKEDYEKEDL